MSVRMGKGPVTISDKKDRKNDDNKLYPKMSTTYPCSVYYIRPIGHFSVKVPFTGMVRATKGPKSVLSKQKSMGSQETHYFSMCIEWQSLWASTFSTSFGSPVK